MKLKILLLAVCLLSANAGKAEEPQRQNTPAFAGNEPLKEIFISTGAASCEMDCSVAEAQAEAAAKNAADGRCSPLRAKQVSAFTSEVKGYGRLTTTAAFTCEAKERVGDPSIIRGLDANAVFHLIQGSGETKGRLNIHGYVTEKRPGPPIFFDEVYLMIGALRMNLEATQGDLQRVVHILEGAGIRPGVDGSGGTTYIEYAVDVLCETPDVCIVQ